MQIFETKTPAQTGLGTVSAKHDAALTNFFVAVLEADRLIRQRKALRDQQASETPNEKAA